MKAVFATPSGVAVRDIEPPLAGPGEVLIQTSYSLISSGTERYYIDKMRHSGESMALGYCVAGLIESAGLGVEGFRPGDRVAAVGWGYAIHAERVRVPVRYCVPVPESVSLEQAVFAPLGATAIHMLRRAAPRRDDAVLFAGAGLLGQLGIQLARYFTGTIIAADRIENRLRAAVAGGARAAIDVEREVLSEAVAKLTDGRGVAIVFVCVHGDATDLFHQCIRCLAAAPDANRRGTIVCAGRFHVALELSAELGNIDIRIASRCGTGYRDDQYAHGLSAYSPDAGEGTVQENLRLCMDRIADRVLDPSVIHTHSFDIGDAAAAFALLGRTQDAIGITLQYGRK